MPPAVPFIPLIAAGVGAAGSAAGGKKGGGGNSVQQRELALQQANSQFGKNLISQGMTSAWSPAANYWDSLLKGGQAAVTAVGPYSDMIRNSTAATNASIAGLPQGGERNLALAQNQVGQANNLARLYAGVQPTAAQALGTLASIPMGAGSSVISSSGPNLGAGVSSQLGNQSAKMQGSSGFGNLLYNATNKNRSSGGGSGGKNSGSSGSGKSSGGGSIYPDTGD